MYDTPRSVYEQKQQEHKLHPAAVALGVLGGLAILAAATNWYQPSHRTLDDIVKK